MIGSRAWLSQNGGKRKAASVTGKGRIAPIPVIGCWPSMRLQFVWFQAV